MIGDPVLAGEVIAKVSVTQSPTAVPESQTNL
jgi:hypothetical protein